MKTTNFFRSLFILLLSFGMWQQASAQVANWRPYDQDGVNVFEPAKDMNTTFEKRFLRVGGSFTQQYQGLEHGNSADEILGPDGSNLNALYDLGSGFNLATANLNLDFQIEDGIRVSLENYMSSRHHSEFWVKGGYIQVDKLPMFNNSDWFDKYLRVKIGHMEVNYGDQHFRRTDNGNAIWNPFVGNYVMDAFATEVGGEVYAFPTENFMVMVGASNGLINGGVKEGTRKPSIYSKLAFDKQLNETTRFRLSGSIYMNSESGRNTLYGGDRTGSRFYEVMESAASQGDFSGRLNPGFTTNVTSFQINPFVKVQGFELFATYEQSQGYASSDPRKEGAENPEKRQVSQIAVEGIYRFLPREQVYVGARYNTVTGALSSRITDGSEEPMDLTVNRMEIAAGWFPTPNLLLKLSYVDQQYKDYPSENIFNEGYFKGVMVEASVGF
ncbi:MAG: hypothetical protein ACRBG0_07345 [Lewinella sp.]|jgi:hypothetical protein|uniref:hypothetical protein n=1 Tax=Lewinella sp. TaxID=2004506 RepID=UPI003D6AA836